MSLERKICRDLSLEKSISRKKRGRNSIIPSVVVSSQNCIGHNPQAMYTWGHSAAFHGGHFWEGNNRDGQSLLRGLNYIDFGCFKLIIRQGSRNQIDCRGARPLFYMYART